MHALVVASRFGMLLGLALWLGLAVALLLAFPATGTAAARSRGRERPRPAGAASTRCLFLALALVLLGLGARSARSGGATRSLIAPVAVMTLSRLLLALAVSPAVRALSLGIEGLAELHDVDPVLAQRRTPPEAPD